MLPLWIVGSLIASPLNISLFFVVESIGNCLLNLSIRSRFKQGRVAIWFFEFYSVGLKCTYGS